jgi:spermidine synthase
LASSFSISMYRTLRRSFSIVPQFSGRIKVYSSEFEVFSKSYEVFWID